MYFKICIFSNRQLQAGYKSKDYKFAKQNTTNKDNWGGYAYTCLRVFLPTQYFIAVEQVVQVHTHRCQAEFHFHTAGHHNGLVHVFGEMDLCLNVRGYVFCEININIILL